jgi:hypothetical protein
MIASLRPSRSHDSEPDRPSCGGNHYQVEYCPNCGTPLMAFRRGFIKLCRAMKVTPKLPPEYECMHCGLDIRRVKIAG